MSVIHRFFFAGTAALAPFLQHSEKSSGYPCSAIAGCLPIKCACVAYNKTSCQSNLTYSYVCAAHGSHSYSPGGANVNPHAGAPARFQARVLGRIQESLPSPSLASSLLPSLSLPLRSRVPLNTGVGGNLSHSKAVRKPLVAIVLSILKCILT